VIQRDTHEALITDAEAEALLAHLEAASVKRPRRTSGEYLFTGLLKTSAGAPWYGEKSRYYRTGNAHAATPATSTSTLLGKIAADLRSSTFSAALVRAGAHLLRQGVHRRARAPRRAETDLARGSRASWTWPRS
jgi:hypothetical protein